MKTLLLFVSVFALVGCAGGEEEVRCVFPDTAQRFSFAYTEVPGGNCGPVDTDHVQIADGAVQAVEGQRISTDRCSLHLEAEQGTYDIEWEEGAAGTVTAGYGTHRRVTNFSKKCSSTYTLEITLD